MTVVTIAYAVTGTLSLHLAIPPGNASSIWPAAAIAVCACLRWGLPMAIAVWLGATVVNLGTSMPAWAAVLIGAGNSLEALTATVLIQRALGPVPVLMRGEDAFKFAAIAAASALIAASVGVAAMYASGKLSTPWLARNWLTWWLGDTTSILIAAPLLLTLHDWFVHRWTRWRWLEFALFLLALAALANTTFGAPPTPWFKPYMLLPMVILAAFRFGLGGVSAVVAFIAALAIYYALRNDGPFVWIADSLNEALISLQIYISVLGIVGIALAALLAQRQRIEQSLRAERDVLEARVAERTAALVRDIETRKQVELSLRLAAQVFEHSSEAIVIADRARRILSVNQAHATISGMASADVVGNCVNHVQPPLQDAAFDNAIWNEVDSAGQWQGEIMRLRCDGRPYPSWTSIVAVPNTDAELTHYIEIFADISERKEADLKIRFMAEHDFLTGLPSRTLMLDRLGQAIAAVQRHGGVLALLFIDLDHFKDINDSMGHTIGDKLLQTVALRLQYGLRSVDTVCRQGGDEFVIMLADAGSLEHVAHVASALATALAEPVMINGHEILATSSIGIAMFPADARDLHQLIKHADMAMYHAKQCGGAQYKFFDSDMNARMNARLALETSLKAAIAKQEFVLEYQPEINMASGRTIGVEALVRWQHPQRGLLLPAHFISTTEDTGMIVAIGDWVLRTACQQARVWRDYALPLIMSVNLSVAQFRQKNLVQSVSDALRDSALEPACLELEITESILIDGADATLATLRALQALGVRLAIDDFGTGYSSLSYLKRLKVDKIKIDQSFVRDLGTDHDDAAIIGAIISMARSLKLTVLAEGVETAEQFGFLSELGCDEYQGFYSSRSLSATDFIAFEASH